MKILPLILVVACIACEVTARAQEEGDGRPAPSRGLLKRGLLAKGKQTTTTTTAAPQEEAEYEEYEEGEGEAQEPSTEAPPSSTEGKKLVAGGVRPFRSNTDLLETLKRRRAQAAEAKLHGHSNVATPAASAQESPAEPAASAKSSYNKARPGRTLPPQPLPPPTNDNTQLNSSTRRGRRRQNNFITRENIETKTISIKPTAVTKRAVTRTGMPRPAVTVYDTPHHTTQHPRKAQRSENIGKKRYNTVQKEVQKEIPDEEASAPVPVKPSRGRFGRPASRSIQEDHEEQNESAPAPIRTGRTFPRRGGN